MNVWPLQSQCNSFYGFPGDATGSHLNPKWVHDNIVHVKCPWILSDGKNHFGSISVHKKCAQSLVRVLNNTFDALHHSQEEVEKHHYNIFSGSLVFRNMRTHHKLSMHSYGCAIDWDAPENMLGSLHHRFTPDELLLTKFREEQWVCGIDWHGASIDAMHVQAARVG